MIYIKREGIRVSHPDASQIKSDCASRAEADFHPFYAAAPAAFSRLGSEVLIAGVRAAEPDWKALPAPDGKLAEAFVAAEPADCEVVPMALPPVDCSALAEADSQEQPKADRCPVGVRAQGSVSVDLSLVDCLAPDDLARAGCSESVPVDWDDFLARLMAADRCVVGVRAQRLVWVDLLPADCLALHDLARAGCSESVPAEADSQEQRKGDRCVVEVRAQCSASADLLPVDCLAPHDLARAGCSGSARVDWDDCPARPRAVGHFGMVLEPVDFLPVGSFRSDDYWVRLPDGCSEQAGFPDAQAEALPLLAAHSLGLAGSVVGYSLESASPVWPEELVSPQEPRWLPDAASAFRRGRSAGPDELATLAVSPKTTQAVAAA